MAETHQEIVKVWIEPGCIVCDACESDSPEVFEVLEDTCIIRKPALDAEFTKERTPSIVIAAEGCPVDVIKYDMIEVDGPEPWAGEDEPEEAAVGTGAGTAAPKKKTGWEPPTGPPEPKWAGLLSAAHTSGSRSSGGPAVTMRSVGATAAKAPVEAVAAAMDANAPPDAQAAAMIGAGFSRPKTNVAEDIRKRGKRDASATRRQFSMALAVGWGSLAAVAGVMGGVLNSFMAPKASKEKPSTIRVGKIGEFAEVGVYNQYKSDNFWIVHLPEGQLICTSTICTHLGCIPNWLQNDLKFKCPCHGSGFTMEGINFEGPAPRPLERHKIWMDGDVVMIDKAFIYREELGQWTDGNSFVVV